jgi:hypothetical protein
VSVRRPRSPDAVQDASCRRWLVVSVDNPRPDPAPLIVVAVMLSRYDEDSWVDIHDTLGIILTLSERSRNDPAFQHESRDQAVIERALNAVPGREAWAAI